MATSITWQSEAHRELPETVPKADADQMAETFRVAILHAIEAAKWPVFCFGQSGRGKSCGMACLYVRWPGRSLWYDVATAIGQVMACRTNGSGFITVAAHGRDYSLTEAQIFKRIAEHSLVIFDDLAIRQPSDAQYEAFYRMINSRVGKPTIVTSNIEPKELENIYDARVASRLLCGSILHVTGVDRRIEQNAVVEV